MEENVLVVKHGALGDFVMSSGRMATVRDRHPRAHVALVTERAFADFARGMGVFDEIIEDSRGYSAATWWRIVKKTLADRRWDAVYDFQCSNRTLCRYYPLALLATSNAMRWGRLAPGGLVWRESTRKIPFLPWVWRNRFERVDWRPPDLSGCRGRGRAAFPELPERYALLIPGCSAGNVQKRWPAGRYRELSRALAERGLRSAVMGTRAEAAEISAVCEGNPDAIDLMGRSVIADIPGLAKEAAVVIGNDTGPSHIAHIAGARTVMLFTDYDYGRAAPKGKANVVSLHAKDIGGIALSDVVAAVDALVFPRQNGGLYAIM